MRDPCQVEKSEHWRVRNDWNSTTDQALDDDDIEFENPFGGEPELVATDPDFRATFRRGRLQVIHHFTTMADNGPVTSLFGERARKGVTIADLSRHSSEDAPDELSVVFRSRGRVGSDAEEAITEWAAAVGYARVWFPDYMVEVEPTLRASNIARVRCPNCAQGWSAGGRSFWVCVWRAKCFPNICTLCGGDLPQWTIDRPPAEQRRPASWEIPAGSTKSRAQETKQRGPSGQAVL